MQWLITYCTENDYNAPQYYTTITAATYTTALLYFMIKYNNAIALDIKQI